MEDKPESMDLRGHNFNEDSLRSELESLRKENEELGMDNVVLHRFKKEYEEDIARLESEVKRLAEDNETWEAAAKMQKRIHDEDQAEIKRLREGLYRIKNYYHADKLCKQIASDLLKEGEGE